MNSEDRQFQEQLRRFSPTSSQHLKDDAMYRAGWNAAQAISALCRKTPHSYRSSIVTFAGGIACGILILGTGQFAFQDSIIDSREEVRIVNGGLDSASVPTVEQIEMPDADAEVTIMLPLNETSNGEGWETQSQLQSISSLLMPWTIVSFRESLNAPVQLPVKTPVSRAAQRQWSECVRSEYVMVVDNEQPVSASDSVDTASLRVRLPHDFMNDDLFGVDL